MNISRLTIDHDSSLSFAENMTAEEIDSYYEWLNNCVSNIHDIDKRATMGLMIEERGLLPSYLLTDEQNINDKDANPRSM